MSVEALQFLGSSQEQNDGLADLTQLIDIVRHVRNSCRARSPHLKAPKYRSKLNEPLHTAIGCAGKYGPG